jgi:hypothetical protein
VATSIVRRTSITARSGCKLGTLAIGRTDTQLVQPLPLQSLELNVEENRERAASRLLHRNPELYKWVNKVDGHNHPVDFDFDDGHQHGDVPAPPRRRPGRTQTQKETAPSALSVDRRAAMQDPLRRVLLFWLAKTGILPTFGPRGGRQEPVR